MRRFIPRLTLRPKILGGFGVILLLFAISSFVGNLLIYQMNENVDIIINQKTHEMVDAANLNLLVTMINSNVRGYLLTGDEEQKQRMLERLAELDELKQEVLEGVEDEELRAQLNELDQWSSIITDRLLYYYDAGDEEMAMTILNFTLLPFARSVQEGMNGYLDEKVEEVYRLGEQAVQKGQQVFWVTAGLSAVAIVLGIGIAFFLTESIVRPIFRLRERVQQLAVGDLRGEALVVRSQDEVGQLARDFNGMVDNLRQLVEQVGVGAEQVASASQQLSATAEETTQAAQQIAATVQEVASGAEMGQRGVEESSRALDELALGIQRVAESSSAAFDTSEKAAAAANEGARAIEEAIQKMGVVDHTMSQLVKSVRMLGERTQEIGKIVEVITDISSQTNLLALNASIEAARAGELGRGFAVVANEIRQLAEQTRGSSEEIIQLIEEIKRNTAQTVQAADDGTAAVRSGTVAVDEAGKAFEKILDTVRQVVMQVQETSAAAEEMSASTEEMTAMFQEVTRSAKESLAGTGTISAATEEQLASMEEVSSSAHSLSRMADELQQLVQRFKI